MKRFLILLSILFCTTVFAHTIEWYVDGTLLSTTTCESGDDITPPTAPDKYGYHFVRWAEYLPIEYLESNGTQYIDTGIKPISVTQMQIKVKVLTTDFNGNSYFLGAQQNQQRFYIGISHSIKKYFFASGIVLRIPYNSASDIVDLTVRVDSNSTIFYTATDSATSTDSVQRPQLNMWLFTNNYNNSLDTTEALRIYSAKIYDNNILVRDFIPVLDANGTPCMYDNVENKFYYNAGTGQFIAGPVLQ